jgi:Alpha-L-arabinofuranosidase B (ABFB) domain
MAPDIWTRSTSAVRPHCPVQRRGSLDLGRSRDGRFHSHGCYRQSQSVRDGNAEERRPELLLAQGRQCSIGRPGHALLRSAAVPARLPRLHADAPGGFDRARHRRRQQQQRHRLVLRRRDDHGPAERRDREQSAGRHRRGQLRWAQPGRGRQPQPGLDDLARRDYGVLHHALHQPRERYTSPPHDGNVVISAISSTSPQPDKDDGTFIVRRGLATLSYDACVSFESRNHPGDFLRHFKSQLFLQPNNGSAQFSSDATFCPEPGRSGQTRTTSFASFNFQDHFIRHWNNTLFIASNGGPKPFDATALWPNDTSWVVSSPWTP